MIAALRVLLAFGYAVLAHFAGQRHDGRLAAIAVGLLVAMLLLRPLLRGRPFAWAALVAVCLGLVVLEREGLALIPLLLMPTALLAWVASWFARSLRRGRVPLITRIVAAMDSTPADRLPDPLRIYTRRLTLSWAWMLGFLAVFNLMLAAIAVPDGLLALCGLRAPWSVTREQWSWFANVCNWGLIGAFFVIEYHARKRRFPGRYDSFADFVRRLAALGPAFWRDFLR